MKDNYSKRRFYLNKREKNNSYNNDINKDKKDHINIKASFSNNSDKKENNIRINTNYLKNEYDKQKNIKNFILYSNESELNNKKEEDKKNINYFNFSHPYKALFSPNNYVNKIKKNNYNDLQSKQEYNILTQNNYNKSFESIKGRFKRNFGENNNKKYNNNDNMNKNINDDMTNFKIKNNMDKEKEKKNNRNKEKNNRNNFFFFYNYRNKKKEIIKIQSIWRGYYSRKIKNQYIKKHLYLYKFIHKFKNIINTILKELYIDIVKLINNYAKKKYTNSKSFQINLTDKYNNYNNKKYYYNNNIKNIKNNNIEENTPKKEGNEINKNVQINNKINKSFKYNNRFKKKEKEKEDIEDDIFNNPIKIIYVPKKIYNKNRYYYLKRITKIKKIKLEEFIKFIHKKFICLYYKILKDKYELNSKFYKAKIIFFIIDSIFKNYKKEYLRIYREKILEKKVNEEIMKKKTLNLIKEDEDNKNKIIINRIIINNNKIIENKKTNKLKKALERNIKVKFKENIINDIIIENIDESENEEENQNIYSKYKRRNKKNNFILLKKIVHKKIEKNLVILNKYFKKWKYFVNDNNKKKIRNMYSPDMEIRGNKSKKRHIKIKYNNRALTSKTSLSSIKSEGRSNSSTNFYIKKMRIRSVVINTNNYSIINYKTENNDIRNIKLSNIIKKIEEKNIINNCFKYWKKNKRIRRNLNKN